MLPNKVFHEKFGIPVVFYDQIGNGASSHVENADRAFWKPELFMDELDNLVKALKVQDNFDLLGHSWGVGQYAASRRPHGLRRLIIANAPASIELFEQGTQKLLNQFPDGFAEMMRRHEENGTMADPEFQEGLMKYNTKHICAMNPWPEELMQSFSAVMKNPKVYGTIPLVFTYNMTDSLIRWGNTDWNIIGTMKGWSAVEIAHQITAPTLLLSAPLDEVQDAAVRPWFSTIPKVKWVELQQSTHLAQFEEPERYAEVVSQFLKY
ncbi:hypothetical protein D9758_018954 [Tetrapyrgos nigripes]|uniref:AB hydrolase-1 domain-containing protein n=1 Tax=Tetrapyrgos nigripes TaxID=182062 RepID=A0A8H5B9J1_9AGAR|nr:hypothetical protein D9758_018954 [Tetrapyrgos nigripes]